MIYDELVKFRKAQSLDIIKKNKISVGISVCLTK